MASKTQTVLVLGAGYCTPPLVRYLSEYFHVVVSNRTLSKAEAITKDLKNAEARQIDVEKESDLPLLEEAIKQADAVISMLPYLYHPVAAELAVKHKKHFLTTSYVSDAMKALEPKAKEAGIIMINECGVDPGTDHMSALRTIDKVHAQGGKIVGFSSFCGGLPAPENNNNPLGYKFSWAPRGVLLASRNTAVYLKDGKEVTIPGEVLFDNYNIQKVEGLESLFEAYPNRNSIQYLDIYNLKGECKSIIRGTYRNVGWCNTVKKLADLGYLDITPKDLSQVKTYAELTASLLKSKPQNKLSDAVTSQLGLDNNSPIIHNFEWIGLFSDDPIPPNTNTVLDALCAAMLKRMKYEEGERDMLVMQHMYVAEFPNEKKRRTYSTRLIDFGIKNGDTSMSRTVGYPVAIVTRLVLEGKYKHLTGLQLPITPEFYNPILDELEKLGIKFIDKQETEEDL